MRLWRTGPVTVLALTATGDLDAQWIYLLEPGTDTVNAYLNGETPHLRHIWPLAS